MPGAQTTTFSDNDESTNRAPVARPNSIVLAFTFNPGKIGATAVPASFCDRFAQQQTNEASRPPLHGFSGTRVVGATEVVHRPARARLPDAEQTRAKPMKPELRIRIFGSGPSTLQGSIVERQIACPCL